MRTNIDLIYNLFSFFIPQISKNRLVVSQRHKKLQDTENNATKSECM